mmetsp:Transcript_8336/g.28587  ORF Transcript_8336/g.28587 Transcript_8336/m.28587 type:complete len:341 (-) Transcript_8336:388-1410(-)
MQWSLLGLGPSTEVSDSKITSVWNLSSPESPMPMLTVTMVNTFCLVCKSWPPKMRYFPVAWDGPESPTKTAEWPALGMRYPLLKRCHWCVSAAETAAARSASARASLSTLAALLADLMGDSALGTTTSARPSSKVSSLRTRASLVPDSTRTRHLEKARCLDLQTPSLDLSTATVLEHRCLSASPLQSLRARAALLASRLARWARTLPSRSARRLHARRAALANLKPALALATETSVRLAEDVAASDDQAAIAARPDRRLDPSRNLATFLRRVALVAAVWAHAQTAAATRRRVLNVSALLSSPLDAFAIATSRDHPSRALKRRLRRRCRRHFCSRHRRPRQ